GAYRDAIADARDVDGRTGHEPGLRGGVLEHIDGNDTDIERRIRCDQLDQVGRGIEMNAELVAAVALELSLELVQRAGDRAAGQHLELSGLRGGDRRRDKRDAQYRDGCSQDGRFHVASPMIVARCNALAHYSRWPTSDTCRFR